jgi:hypothetical protein
MPGGDAGDATVQLRPKVRRADGARQGRCRDHDWRRTRSEICLWRIALSETRGVVQQSLILKRASASRPSGEWNDDDFDVLADGIVVGRIMKAAAAPEGTPWMWTLAFGHHEDRTQTHGYTATREAAVAAFAKSWRRE